MDETANVIWALREAAKPTRFTPIGFTPNEVSVVEFVRSLERKGWLHESERGPTWTITPKGRSELARLEAEADISSTRGPSRMTEDEMRVAIGERVFVTANDYSYDGWLVAVFSKHRGGWRCVVEDFNGRLFIHNASQLSHGKA